MQKILLFILVMCFQSIFSQISMEKNKLVKDGVKYKFSKYEEVFQNNEAKSYFKKARTNKTIGEIFAYTGGFSLGFGIGQIIAHGKTTTYSTPYGTITVKPDNSGAWTAIGIGAGLIGIGIPLAIASNKNAKKALEIENGVPTALQPYFKLESAENGLALSYNF